MDDTVGGISHPPNGRFRLTSGSAALRAAQIASSYSTVIGACAASTGVAKW
ncbi:MAG: hypothetical protein ABI040_04870 [Rhodoferax sp.]